MTVRRSHVEANNNPQNTNSDDIVNIVDEKNTTGEDKLRSVFPWIHSVVKSFEGWCRNIYLTDRKVTSSIPVISA